jgi:hypothetical protein
MKKTTWITLTIVVLVIALAIFILNKPAPMTDASVAKCIGENSVLYVQLGCHACETQEEMFGGNYDKLNVIDCFFERDKCGGIEATPTWKINGKNIRGVQSIEELQELTGC